MRGKGIGAILILLLAAMLGLASPVSAEPVSATEANQDMTTAVNATNAFWAAHWSQFFTGQYSAPRSVGLYDSRVTDYPCRSWGGVPTANNAWYCADTDSVGFDTNFMSRVFNLGDSFLYLVAAHEWGHAIQQRLQSSLKYQAQELQADCLAGAALIGATRDGNLTWDADDSQELAASLTNVGDQYAWTKVGDHGSPAERIANFNQGANGGVLACVPH
jgi:predicted metalloprotease